MTAQRGRADRSGAHQRGLCPEAPAARAGPSRSLPWTVEKDCADISVQRLFRLADGLHMVPELFRGRGEVEAEREPPSIEIARFFGELAQELDRGRWPRLLLIAINHALAG